MRENWLKTKLGQGRAVLGPFMKLSDPASIEIAALAGCDFAVIDLEHGPCSIERVQDMIRAAELRGLSPVVRVSANAPASIQRALDIGAHAVQVPHVSTAAEASAAVHAARFRPEGERGVCRFTRAADYSARDGIAYLGEANREVALVLQVEGVEGIDNLPAILAVAGLDVIFIGPYDLSQSCGVPGRINHSAVAERMRGAVALAAAAGVPIGTFVDDLDAARRWVEAGVRYVCYSVDTGILLDAFRAVVRGFGAIAPS